MFEPNPYAAASRAHAIAVMTEWREYCELDYARIVMSLARVAAMEPDPIIEEIHAIREALSRASGHGIRKIAEAAKARQAESGRKTLRLPPRKAKAARKAS